MASPGVLAERKACADAVCSRCAKGETARPATNVISGRPIFEHEVKGVGGMYCLATPIWLRGAP